MARAAAPRRGSSKKVAARKVAARKPAGKKAAAPSLPLWKGKPQRVSVPKTRDPFINSCMTRLAPDASGLERFFISTYNSNGGSIAACINEAGEHRLYHFNKPVYPGFYGVAPEDPDTLWLCGTIDRVGRFDLRSGKIEMFQTGAPSALVFQGLVYDPPTGKLLATAFPPPNTTGFIFDTRLRKPVKTFQTPREFGGYMRLSMPNADGTWTILMHMPGWHLHIWDPRTDKIETITIKETYAPHDTAATTYMLIRDDAGRIYFPDLGWYDLTRRAFASDGPRPQSERTWFGRHGQTAWGLSVQGGTATIARWDMQTGKVHSLATIPDCPSQAVNLTGSGKIVAVNLYGEFFRFDGQTGALECTRRLDATGVGHIDTLCLIDDRRLLGTPFITQRFWEADLKTGRGEDMGRAAPNFGEIMQIKKVGSKVYMAAYADGELTEYDPALPARFPENPRVVADPPLGMRPVAIDSDGRNVFYSSSLEYGRLGSVVTRYDVRTGVSAYGMNPLGDQQINSLFCEKKTNSLIVATTVHADCQSAPATTNRACIARLDATTFEPLERIDAPAGTEYTSVLGLLSPGVWVACWSYPWWSQKWWFALKSGAMAAPTEADQRPWPMEKLSGVAYAGVPGKFVISTPEHLGVWDLAKGKLLRVLPSHGQLMRKIFVQDKSVMFHTSHEVWVLRDALAGI